MGGHNVIATDRGKIAVRADRLKLLPASAPHARLSGTVRGVEYQGTHVQVTLAAADATELTATLAEAAFDAIALTPGERVASTGATTTSIHCQKRRERHAQITRTGERHGKDIQSVGPRPIAAHDAQDRGLARRRRRRLARDHRLSGCARPGAEGAALSRHRGEPVRRHRQEGQGRHRHQDRVHPGDHRRRDQAHRSPSRTPSTSSTPSISRSRR